MTRLWPARAHVALFRALKTPTWTNPRAMGPEISDAEWDEVWALHQAWHRIGTTPEFIAQAEAQRPKRARRAPVRLATEYLKATSGPRSTYAAPDEAEKHAMKTSIDIDDDDEMPSGWSAEAYTERKADCGETEGVLESEEESCSETSEEESDADNSGEDESGAESSDSEPVRPRRPRRTTPARPATKKQKAPFRIYCNKCKTKRDRECFSREGRELGVCVEHAGCNSGSTETDMLTCTKCGKTMDRPMFAWIGHGRVKFHIFHGAPHRCRPRRAGPSLGRPRLRRLPRVFRSGRGREGLLGLSGTLRRLSVCPRDEYRLAQRVHPSVPR